MLMRPSSNSWLSALISMLIALFFSAGAIANASENPSVSPKENGKKITKLRLQLHRDHQAQFAGFYVAQSRNYFAEDGLEVEIIPGGPGINPITEIQEGRADIAVTWLSNAWRHSKPAQSVTNIA